MVARGTTSYPVICREPDGTMGGGPLVRRGIRQDGPGATLRR